MQRGKKIVIGKVIFHTDLAVVSIIFNNKIFLPITYGCPNETEKVGQLIIPAALIQQHIQIRVEISTLHRSAKPYGA